jgi:hypothetical protein
MTLAVAGPGWALRHAGTLIAEVRDIDGPQQKADMDNATNQSSPGHYKEWVTTLIDGGDVKFACNYVPGDSSQIALLTALKNRVEEAYTLTDPSGASTISFNARVMTWHVKSPHAKIATIDIDLRVTGEVTVA